MREEKQNRQRLTKSLPVLLYCIAAYETEPTLMRAAEGITTSYSIDPFALCAKRLDAAAAIAPTMSSKNV